jgi:hypothetical protein
LTPSPSNTPANTPTRTSMPTSPPVATNTAEATATVGSSATPTPVTTSTATATACPIQFSDVPPGSAFYPFVRCLACRHILSGYPDGTFRPNNPMTRGQLSKVVSNAAGFDEPHTNQTFEDVQVGSTFHLFIERLSSRGVIGGYACGGPAEPCDPPDNKPYFRPNAHVTRGQASKIVATAAGLPDPPSGSQTFEDIPLNHTFYRWIERMALEGVISGYDCGGPAEPCSPPDNRPYFRPNAGLTRGQASKIVSNTFFRGCAPP